MNKLRGQAVLQGLIMFAIAFLIGLGFVTPLGTAAQTATANATITPTNGLTYIIANLTPAIFLIMIWMSYMAYNSISRQNQA